MNTFYDFQIITANLNSKPAPCAVNFKFEYLSKNLTKSRNHQYPGEAVFHEKISLAEKIS